MSQHSAEEYALGFEDCRCDGLSPVANDAPCVSCGKRVKYGDHVHFKGQLFHDWCLMVAALKQARQVRIAANHLATAGDVESYDVASKFFESTDSRVLDLKDELEQYAVRQIRKIELPLRALAGSISTEGEG